MKTFPYKLLKFIKNYKIYNNKESKNLKFLFLFYFAFDKDFK